MTGRRNLRLAAAAALCLGVGGIHAAAADDPAFSFAAPAKPAEVKWSANAQPSPGATASLGAELLTNVAGEDTPTDHVSPFRDDRIAGRAELSLKLNDRGRLAMRVNAKYDSHPAPKPPPAGTSWAPGYVPLADRLDTRTELLFVYSFL